MRQVPSRQGLHGDGPVHLGPDVLAGQPVWLERPRRSLLGTLRAARRIATVLVLTALAMPVQAANLVLPGSGKVRFACLFWRSVYLALGVHVRMLGRLPAKGRPILFVSNHSSWLDIPVLGGTLPGCFISKGEVGEWPVISTVARLGRTVFVSRRRNATVRELEEMRNVLARGDNLILFPEGTTSDGSRVMPFRSAFFALAAGERPPLIQPVSIVYDRLDGMPLGRMGRAQIAWIGDQDIGSHAWEIAQHRRLGATVFLHAPIDPADYPDRKALARTVWEKVAEGAAALRQSRPLRGQVPAPP